MRRLSAVGIAVLQGGEDVKISSWKAEETGNG